MAAIPDECSPGEPIQAAGAAVAGTPGISQRHVRCHYVLRGSMDFTAQVKDAECHFVSGGKILQSFPRRTYHFKGRGLAGLGPAEMLIARILRYIPPRCVVAIPASELCRGHLPTLFSNHSGGIWIYLVTYETTMAVGLTETDLLCGMIKLSCELCMLLEDLHREKKFRQSLDSLGRCFQSHSELILPFMAWHEVHDFYWEFNLTAFYGLFLRDAHRVETIPWDPKCYHCYYLHRSHEPPVDRASIHTLYLEWRCFDENGNTIDGSGCPRLVQYQGGRPCETGLSKWEILAAMAAVQCSIGSVVGVQGDDIMIGSERLMLAVFILGSTFEGISAESKTYLEQTLLFATPPLAMLLSNAGADVHEQLKALFDGHALRMLLDGKWSKTYFSVYVTNGLTDGQGEKMIRDFLIEVIASRSDFSLAG